MNRTTVGNKDYYQVLGVPRTASADKIRTAFHKLALKYHPDRNAGSKQAEEKFKEINEAYQVLSDPEERARYDSLSSDANHRPVTNYPADSNRDQHDTKPKSRWEDIFEAEGLGMKSRSVNPDGGRLEALWRLIYTYPRLALVLLACLVFPIVAISLFARSQTPIVSWCQFFYCAPASWETTQDIIFAQVDPGFQIASVEATPSGGETLTGTEPNLVNLHITYTSLMADPIDTTKYTVKYLTFDDRSLKTNLSSPEISQGWSWVKPPSSLVVERVRRVKISPREAYRVTWELAKAQLLKEARLAELLFDDVIPKSLNCESVWAVHYVDAAYQKERIFYVDAQTGKFLLMTNGR
jgi:hypothetical protein